MTPATEEQPTHPKETGLFRNSVSLVGGVLAVVAAANIAFLVVVDYLTPAPYLGIFAYMILPAIMILGLILIPIGMSLERRRRAWISTIPANARCSRRSRPSPSYLWL